MARNTSQWVDYIQTLHSREIDMTLERVSEVTKRLCPKGVEFKVISIAGTNGKGSTAELLSSIYHASGYKIGKFTSPHILSFNERFNLNRRDVDDQELLLAFNEIEQVRGDIAITYFEYCFLLAVVIFVRNGVDIAIMEIGLGGRLDAVNILDADISVITNISIDHVDWLGDNIDLIGMEKIGIARANKPCVIGMNQPPEVMLQYCVDNEIPLSQLNCNFNYQINIKGNGWCWENNFVDYENLPLPFAQNNIQVQNAASALQVIHLLQHDFPVSEFQLKKGIRCATLSGRCQIIQQSPMIIVDVSHNEESIECLSEFLKTKMTNQGVLGRVYAICGMLQDKQVSQSLAYLIPLVDEWHVANINHDRGSKAEQIQLIVDELNSEQESLVPVNCYEHVIAAYDTVKPQLNLNDCLVVFGSFFIVSDIIKHIENKDPID